MRTFVAIDLGSEVRARMGNLSRDLAPRLAGARFVPAGNLHLTLRFLGHTTQGALESIRAGLERLSAPLWPFALRFRGIGFFPNAGRPRVLWVGMEDVPESLSALQESVERLALECGFEPETRSFSPHITLARFKAPRPCPECPALLTAFGETDLGQFTAEALTLYESHLLPSGARYRALARPAFLGGN